MATRRDALHLIAAGAVLLSTKTFLERAGAAGAVTVEVLAMTHWPVQNALKPAREVLARYDGRIRVVDLDIESSDGEKRAKSVGVKGHIPLVILINGSRSFKRADGKTIDFVNFPAASGSPMGLNGTWTVADLEAAVRAAIGP
jgi:hypothetical protein